MSKKNINRNSIRKVTSELRKDFYKRLLYIGLCIIPIYIFAENQKNFRLVPLPFFLIGMYQLIIIIKLYPHIIDDFFPPKTVFEKSTKSFDKFMYHFSLTIFFISLICLLFEIRKYENTILGAKLFWTAGLTGILIAIVLTAILKKITPSVYFESKRRYTVHFGLFFGLFFLTSAVVGFINHFYADKTKICKTSTIIRKDSGGSRSKKYFIYLKLDNNLEEQFPISKNKYENFIEGEEIELCTVKGKFGFDYVTDFNKINK